MPICFVVHLFITIVNDGYLSLQGLSKRFPLNRPRDHCQSSGTCSRLWLYNAVLVL